MDNGILNSILRTITGRNTTKNVPDDGTRDSSSSEIIQRIFGGWPVENAGESEMVVPKSPSFVTPDPVWKRLKDSNMDDELKNRLYNTYKQNIDSLDENSRANLRKRLGTDSKFLDEYINGLYEEDARLEQIFPIIRGADDALDYQKRSSRGIGVERNA